MEVDYDEYMSDSKDWTEDEIKFYIWFKENEESILIEIYEQGLANERDFDLDAYFDKLYADYL